MRRLIRFLALGLLLAGLLGALNALGMPWWYGSVLNGEAEFAGDDLQLRVSGGFLHKVFGGSFTIRMTGPEMRVDLRNLGAETRRLHVTLENLPKNPVVEWTGLPSAAEAASFTLDLDGGAMGSVRVAARQAPKFRFAVISDAHGNLDMTERIAGHARREGADFVAGLGDYGAGGTLRSLEAWQEFYDARAGIPLYAAPGNHDTDKGELRENYLRVFGPRYHAVVYGTTLLLFLDNSEETLDPVQLAWARQRIAEHEPFVDSILILAHYPFPSMPQFNYTFQDPAAEAAARELFSHPKCKAVFAGHVHVYQFLDGAPPTYIAGGCGGTLEFPEAWKPCFHYLLVDVNGADVRVSRVDMPAAERPSWTAGRFVIEQVLTFWRQHWVIPLMNAFWAGTALWLVYAVGRWRSGKRHEG